MSNENVVHTEIYKGYKINILPDNDSGQGPREWDNAGKMVCWHSRYNLGDDIKDTKSPDDYLTYLLQAELKYDSPKWQAVYDMTITELLAGLSEFYIFMPLYLYDHSGISISARSFVGRAQHAEWDSGQVGWIYISKKDAVKEWGKKLYTKTVELKAVEYLQCEVKTYDDYITGNVYGYEVCEFSGEDDDDGEDGDVLESCWGYYPEGDEYPSYKGCLDEAKSQADWLCKQAEQVKWESAQIVEQQAVCE